MNRVVFAVLTAMLAFVIGGATAQAAPNRPATPPPTDFWQKLGFINMAHQGGERENPGNTMFAFKKALADGADAIDMDLTLTQDGVLIATHDGEPCHTSNGPCTDFRDLTLSQVRTYDFGYWFSPGLATYYDKSLGVPHPYRGMATGDVTPPTGYTASDFRISTFDEILDAFPDTPMNVELKPYADTEATAEAAAAALAAHPGREADVIVNAFSQAMIEAFHAAAPNHLALGGSLEKTLAYVQGNPITPTPVAVQPPDKYNLGGNIVDTLPLLSPHFEHDGFIAVVWPSDIDEAQETDPWYGKLIEQGAGAINTMFPSRLHEYLCENGVASPDGSPRCPAQVCPEGQTGIAPDNCVDIPVCPEGTTGTPPDCVVTPVAAKVSKVQLKPAKSSIKAGKKKTLTLLITVSNGKPGGSATINLKSSNRNLTLPKKITVSLLPKRTLAKKITVRAKRNAQGKATITATAGKLKSRSVLTVKRPARKR